MPDFYSLYTLSAAAAFQIHVINSDYEIVFPHDFRYHDDIFEKVPALASDMYKSYEGGTYITHDVNSPNIFYGIFGYNNDVYVIGPCTMSRLDKPQLHAFTQAYNLNSDFEITISTSAHLFHTLACTKYSVTGNKVTVNTVLQKSSEIVTKDTASDENLTRNFFERSIHQLFPASDDSSFEIASLNVNTGNENISGYVSQVNLLKGKTDRELPYYEAIFLSQMAENARRKGVTGATADNILSLYLSELHKYKTEVDILSLHYSAMNKFEYEIQKATPVYNDNAHISSALDYLDNHIHHKLTLDEMANQLHLSKHYMCRMFKESVGCTITGYLTSKRLEGAANMLRYSDYSYSDISDYFCFSSQSRFISAFKEKYGMTPVQYRKENQRI